MTTLYDLLGVSPDARPDEVRDAYRRAARRHHPDANGGGAASERMAALNEAWRVLGDPARRRAYDETLGEPRVASTSRAGGAARQIPVEPRFNPLARYQNPPRIPWRAMAVVAALGAVAVLVMAALAPDAPAVPAVVRLVPGQCVDIASDGSAGASLCDGSQDGVVDTIVEDPLRCPQHTEVHVERDGGAIVCVRV